MATLVDFRIQFPEFDPVPDATVQYYLTKTGDFLSQTYWGTCFDEAVCLLSAHELALSQNRQANAEISPGGEVVTSSSAGPITQASVGQISASFAANATSMQGGDRDAWLMRTDYGQQYLALKRTCLPHALGADCQGVLTVG